MRLRFYSLLGLLGVFAALMALHSPFLRLPYFWDEAGYYLPSALDFFRHGHWVPRNTSPTGHTPLVGIYLACAWRVFGFSPLVTRTAMILVASATLVTLYTLAKVVRSHSISNDKREIAAWSTLLLALSALFFAQSSLAHLDLTAAVFTTLGILALLRGQIPRFALAASLAVLSKETAVILLPVAWLFVWTRRREEWGRTQPRSVAGQWAQLVSPLLPLVAWSLYYHHVTGFWTGNREYLEYNLYATLNPIRILFSLLRRLYEVFVGGFNWVLVVAGIMGFRWQRRQGVRDSGFGARGLEPTDPEHLGSASVTRNARVVGPKDEAHEPNSRPSPARTPNPEFRTQDFLFLSSGLCVAYVLMLSVVGGAILPRYLLPVYPTLFLTGVLFIWRLPKTLARSICLTLSVCLVASWFINPPYPFPFEDNVSYADFVRLHQDAARFLESEPGNPRILTAWPASDELQQPFLGYVNKPLQVLPVEGFASEDFSGVSPQSFDLLYFYSRRWEPANNWLVRLKLPEGFLKRYFGYAPQIPNQVLVSRYHLQLLQEFERRGQWVQIYRKQQAVDSRHGREGSWRTNQKAEGERPE